MQERKSAAENKGADAYQGQHTDGNARLEDRKVLDRARGKSLAPANGNYHRGVED